MATEASDLCTPPLPYAVHIFVNLHGLPRPPGLGLSEWCTVVHTSETVTSPLFFPMTERI